MPMYEYKCAECGTVFELIQRFSDAPLTTHEVCGGAVERLISAPALQFKGSGWYATDYAKGSTSRSNGASKSESSSSGDPKSESKSESKSDSKPESKSESKTESKSESKPGSKTESKPAPASTGTPSSKST
jgi:putative FmdB family regulatory protein